MSAPAKTSDRKIREAVRNLLERAGEQELSMQAIAAAAGIRAPSLYKRFASKSELLSAAAREGLLELAELLGNPAGGSKTYESLERMGHLYRKFAKKNPRTYALIFSQEMASRQELLGHRQAVAEPMMALLTPLLGKDAALNAARMLVSYLHGFLSMELARTFRLGGNVNEAFQYGLTKTLDSLLAEKAQHG
jgi:AcrR family transcriptional regulator